MSGLRLRRLSADLRLHLRKTSLVDYPSRISSVLFFVGCNLRCPWCHNRDLVTGEARGTVTFEEALSHLKKRQPVLGGVVLSGGEPCLHKDLPDIIEEIKSLPLPVKIDTNGMFPGMLKKLFSREETRPDYIAMDLKLEPSRYINLLPPGGKPRNPARALIQSAALVRDSGIAHEFRSLTLPAAPGSVDSASGVGSASSFFSEKDILALAPLAKDSPWHFRPFRGGNCLDPAWDSLNE